MLDPVKVGGRDRQTRAVLPPRPTIRSPWTWFSGLPDPQRARPIEKGSSNHPPTGMIRAIGVGVEGRLPSLGGFETAGLAGKVARRAVIVSRGKNEANAA